MNKPEFHSQLINLLKKKHCTMPFWACGKNGKGHPLEARLLFVGFNPSSAPKRDWLSYWDAETGFDMGKYQLDHSKASKTRKNIFSLTGTTLQSEFTYVNTNVYWTASSRKKHLKKPTPGELRWLIECLPKDVLIIAHGKKAQASLRDLPVIPFHHLSGLGLPKGVYFKNELTSLATQLSERLRGGKSELT